MKPNALAVTLALVACADPADIDSAGDALLRTSAVSYTLANRGERFEVDIPFTFDNRTGSEVYVTSCTGTAPPFLERRDGDRWRTAWKPVDYGCSLSGPRTIAAGELYADTLHVLAYAFGGEREPRHACPD